MDLALGARVTASIRLVRKLGSGGMGSVWIADHDRLKTQVAVKFMSERALLDESAVHRFVDEAAAAARIRSPHVAQVFDHGVTDGIPYIVMELLEGEDLRVRLAREGRLGTTETVRIARQTALALAKAHAANVIHRDIKPANIFLIDVGGETFVKLLDFGVAKLGDAPSAGQTLTAAIFGTPHYMSPEQCKSSRDVAPSADLWSLAVVVYRCLTGKLPFDAPTLFGIFTTINEARFTPATALRAGLPPAIDQWFARALSREVSDRFVAPSAMVEALVLAVESGPTLDGHVGDETWRSGVRERGPRPNVKAQALLNAARYIEDAYGREVLDAILSACSAGVRERCATGIAINWHPLEELTDFLEASEHVLRDPTIGEKVGAAGARANTRGVMLQVAMLLVRPENVIRRAATMWRQFNDAGELTLVKSAHGSIEIEITGLPPTPRVFCDTITGWARELATSAGGKNASAAHVQCRSARGARCIWVVRWSGIAT